MWEEIRNTPKSAAKEQRQENKAQIDEFLKRQGNLKQTRHRRLSNKTNPYVNHCSNTKRNAAGGLEIKGETI